MDAATPIIPYENQMEHYFGFIMKLISDFSFGSFINDDPILKDALVKCLPLMHEELFGREYDNISIYTVGKFTREIIGDDVSLLKKCDEKRVCFEIAFIMLFNFIHKVQLANDMYENVEAMLKKYPDFKNLCPYETNKLLAFANVMKVVLRVVPAKNHKNHVLDIVTRITEGREVKYVTGSGQTQATARRVQIYEQEGDIKPQPRPPRKICLKTKQLCNQNCQLNSNNSSNDSSSSSNDNIINSNVEDIENNIHSNNNSNPNTTSGCCSSSSSSSSSSSAHTPKKDPSRSKNTNNNTNKRSFVHTVIAYEESDLFDIDLDLDLDLGLDLDQGWDDHHHHSLVGNLDNHSDNSNEIDEFTTIHSFNNHNNNNNTNTNNTNTNNNTANNTTTNNNNNNNNRKAVMFRSLSIDDMEDFSLQSAAKLPRSCDGCSQFEKCHTHGLAHVQEQEDWLNILASEW